MHKQLMEEVWGRLRQPTHYVRSIWLLRHQLEESVGPRFFITNLESVTAGRVEETRKGIKPHLNDFRSKLVYMVRV